MLKIKNFIFVLFLFIFSFPLYAEEDSGDFREAGSLYDNAQVLRWLNSENFIIGRWDSALSIFKMVKKDNQLTPTLSQLLQLPSHNGVQMITTLTPSMFVTSNETNSLTVWAQENGIYKEKSSLSYPAEAGMANSGVIAKDASGKTFLITGHANGYIIIWKTREDGEIALHAIRDIHSPNPLPPPHNFKNIRGLGYWKDNMIISGSEDGDIALISIPDGKVIARMRYNPSAQKGGICSIAIKDDYLILGSYAADQNDRNLFLYKLNRSVMPTYLDSAYFTQDPTKTVYTFDTALSAVKNELNFFASTGEGLLWYGTIKNDKLNVVGKKRIEEVGGAAIAINNDNGCPCAWTLASAQHVIRLFVMGNN